MITTPRVQDLRDVPATSIVGNDEGAVRTAKALAPADVRTLVGVYSTSEVDTLLGAKAPLASPGLTGTPTAPTASAATNNTQLATTAFVHTVVADVIASAPTALDTLNELAAALGNDANFAATMTASIATKAPLASPGLTGTPTAPTADVDTNNTQIATTAFVIAQASAAGDGTPAMDGAAARGTSTHFARADHVHPTDTSRAAASHTHTSGDVTDFAEAARDAIGAALVQGSNITITVNDGADTITIAATGGGSPGGSSGQVQYNNGGSFGGAGIAWSSSTPNVTITAQGTTHVPLLMQMAASQTADVLQAKNSSGNILFRGTRLGAIEAGWGGSGSSNDVMALGPGDSSLLNLSGTAYHTNRGISGASTWMLRSQNNDVATIGGTGITMTEARNIIFGTATGTKLGTAANQKLGFYNATPVIQPANANQAAVTDTAGATYTAAEQTMLANLKTLVNQIRADLVTLGLLKGSA